MKLTVIGHSLVHIRQRRFFAHVARLGHDVLVVCPNRWAHLDCLPSTESGPGWSYTISPLPAPGQPDMYQFGLLGLAKVLTDFHPDVVYVQEEVGARITRQALDLAKELGAARTLFVWENQQAPTPAQEELLRQLDLLVCGNDAAAGLHSAAPTWCILPQVGVDTDHFQARNTPRDQRAIFVANEPPGTRRPEKGFDLAKRAWPTMGRLEFTPFRAMPWAYSQIQVVVCPSIDSTWWREQAMPYVAVEANSCFVPAIVSDAGSIPYWHTRFAGTNPGVKIIPTGGLELREAGGKVVMASRSEAIPEGLALKMARDLADAIGELLGDEGKRVQMGKMGRDWVMENLSNRVIAKKLVEALSG